MRLSSIKLAGFKSFCDPVTLDLPSDRTVLVGPNGCGKSNIIDAIRWVLGESSASGLRSDSMEDVIFNGTEQNPPRGRAMVEMEFNNDKKRLTGKYKGLDKVKIKRILERDRDSHYYINDAPCRKKDISELFAGMGLTGKTDYAIVTQGAVHSIVESKPEHVRSIIEEAADIAGYLAKRKETLLHIKNTKDNLRTISSNLSEMRHRVRSLERQAATATVFKNNNAELDTLKEQLTFSLYNELVGRKNAKREALDELVHNIDAAKNNSALWQTQRQEKSLAEDGLKTELTERAKQQQELANKIANIEARGKYNQKNRQEKEFDLETIKNETKANNNQLKLHAAELKSAREELAKIKQSQGTSVRQARQELMKLEEELTTANQRWQCVLNSAVEINNRYKDSDAQLQRLQDEEKIIAAKLANISNKQKDYNGTMAELSSLDKERQKIEKEISDLAKQQESLRKEELKLTKEIATNDNKYRSVADEYLQSSTLLAELQQESGSANISDKVKNLLSHMNINPANIWGDKVEVAAGWEKALDTVAAQIIQANLTKDLGSNLKDLGQEQDIQLSLIEEDEFSEKSDLSGYKSLAQMVKQANRPSFLNHIYVCDSMEDALAIHDKLKSYQSLVTKNGAWLGKNWAILKHGDKQEDEVHSIARKKRKETLSQKVTQLQKDKVGLEKSLQELKQAKSSYQDKFATGQTQLSELKQSLIKNEQIIIYKKSVVQNWQAESRQQEQQDRQSHHRHKEISTQLKQVEQELEVATRTRDEHEGQRIASEEIRNGLIDKVNKLKQQRHQEEERQEQEQERREELLSIISGIETAIIKINRDNVKLEGREKELLHETFVARNLTKTDDGMLAELNRENKKLNVVIANKEKQLAQIQNNIRELDHKLNRTEKELAVLEEKLRRSRGDENQLELELDELEKRIPQEMQNKKIANIGDPQAIKAHIRILERENARIGDVNMLALKDYETEQEKYDNLLEQEQQINTALQNLHKAIRRIDRASKVKFDSTFKKINITFTKVFSTLTDGGKARLEMDPEDESRGVRIMASPPGKRNNVLSLLSGGEKTVTAIAFIMAIFQLNPTPFCLMDEADAMLDDLNVIRFNRMMNEMARETAIQFIIITHSKLSIQEAKHLIGITMSEPGMSRVVTVDMHKALELSQEEAEAS